VKEGFFVTGGNSFQVVTDNGHGCTLTYLAPGMREENYRTHAPELQRLYAQTLAPDQVAMLHHLRVCVGTVFPNFSFRRRPTPARSRSSCACGSR
jgi:hypothetical protein